MTRFGHFWTFWKAFLAKNRVALDSMENCSARGSQSSVSQLVLRRGTISYLVLAKPIIVTETTQPAETKLLGAIHKLRNPIID